MHRHAKLAFALIVGVVLPAAAAQGQVQGTVAPGPAPGTYVAPPLLQGIVVDATGKTVGRIYPNAAGIGGNLIIRQIEGIWVGLPLSDLTSWLHGSDPATFPIYYPSLNCTRAAYALTNGNAFLGPGFPSMALVAVVPPSTAPYIYFAGTPALVQLSSVQLGPAGNCTQVIPPPISLWAGTLISAPVSSLGLTLPFKVK
jgi:hypothetical protein